MFHSRGEAGIARSLCIQAEEIIIPSGRSSASLLAYFQGHSIKESFLSVFNKDPGIIFIHKYHRDTTTKIMDDFLKERLIKYDTWLDRGQISFSSKIIPTRESLSAQQWVLPSEQVLNILQNAQSIAVQKCGCRVHFSRCDKPLEVCFLLNETGEHSIAKGRARPVSLSEAADIVRKADEYGLVHLTLYQPDHEIYALCNCCPCCCHDLQLMKVYNRRDLVVRSGYVAVTDKGSCINCGKCVERCIFDARTFDDGRMLYNAGLCLGCGLCFTVCPVHATVMQQRDP